MEHGSDRAPALPNGRIPDVVGLEVDNARSRLARRQLGVKQTYADSGEPGVVLAQFPRAGLAATRNMTVRLVIGRG